MKFETYVDNNSAPPKWVVNMEISSSELFDYESLATPIQRKAITDMGNGSISDKLMALAKVVQLLEKAVEDSREEGDIGKEGKL